MWFRHVLKVVAISAPIVFLVAAFALLPPARSRLRPCGHPQPWWVTSHIWAATHCCSAGSMINALRMIDGAQEMYRQENGVFATRFDQLTNHLGRIDDFQFEFRSDGTNWSISVPPQETFPGYYFFTDFHLYFNQARPVTAADLDLGAKK